MVYNNAANINPTGLVKADGSGGFSGETTTLHGIQIGAASNGLTSQVLTNGQLLIGSTGAAPVAATLTAGTGVSITNGAGSITINSTGGGSQITFNTDTAPSTTDNFAIYLIGDPANTNIIVNGGVTTINPADTIEIQLNSDIVLNSIQTNDAGTGNEILEIVDNTISANLSANTDVDVGIIPKNDAGLYVQHNFTLRPAGQSGSITSIPYNGGNLGVTMLVDTEGSTDLGGIVDNRHTNTAAFGGHFILARSRGTHASPTTVAANDILGRIAGLGYDGTEYNDSAEIRCKATGTIAAGKVPAQWEFYTADNATGALQLAMTIDNGQRITQPLQPAFSASLSADVANATGDGTAYTIAFNTEQYDQGGDFAANTFTAPVAGRYRFNYTISVDDLLVGHTKMEVTVGGRMVERCNPFAIADSDGFCLMSGSVDLSLAASATVTMVVTITGSTKTVTVKGTTSSGTFLSGQLQV